MKKIALVAGALALPIVTFAQSFYLLNTLVTNIGNLINLLIPIVFTLALLVFFWGLVRYIWGKDHDKEAAKKTMIWGVVALFVMAAVWGLVVFIANTLGVNNTQGGPSISNLLPQP